MVLYLIHVLVYMLSFVCNVIVFIFCRLNALEYKDLKDKLTTPIVNARNIVIKQSLSDQFLDAFRHQVNLNQVFHMPDTMVTHYNPHCTCAVNPNFIWASARKFSMHGLRESCCCEYSTSNDVHCDIAKVSGCILMI